MIQRTGTTLTAVITTVFAQAPETAEATEVGGFPFWVLLLIVCAAGWLLLAVRMRGRISQLLTLPDHDYAAPLAETAEERDAALRARLLGESDQTTSSSDE